MKISIIVNLFLSFVFFFIGIGGIIGAALTKNLGLMYAGIVFLILGAIGYLILMGRFLYMFLKNKR